MNKWLGLLISGIAIPAWSSTVGTLPGELSIEQGVAYYQVPLNLPSGIGGIRPEIALSYSSAGTLRSTLGAGFTLGGLSSINRCGDVPYIDDDYNTITLTETDNYCLDGNRLIAVNGTVGKDQSVYTTYINTQAKLTLSGDTTSSNSYFVLQEKNGSSKRYNYHELSQSWLLASELSHPKSAAINYHYDDLGQLASIEYDIYQVRFNYKNIYNSASSFITHSKVNGIVKAQREHLNKIDININGKLKNYYKFHYDLKTGMAETTGAFLSTVEYCDKNDVCMPETRFDWQAMVLPQANKTYFDQTVLSHDLQNWGNMQMPANWGAAVAHSWWVDINGNGISDFCKTGNTGLICHLDVGTNLSVKTYPISKWGDKDAHWWVDINRDSKTDFCRVESAQLHCDSFNADGTTEKLHWPLSLLGMKEFRWWKDTNANGVPEYCRRLGDELLCSEPQADGEWFDTVSVKGVQWSSSDSTFWVDLNGDGSSDLCSVDYRIVRCTYFSGSDVLEKNKTYSLSAETKVNSRWWVDVNGDGASDFCRVTKNDFGQEKNLTCSLGSLGKIEQLEDDVVLVGGIDWTAELGAADKRWWVDLDQDGVVDFCRGVGNTVKCSNINKRSYDFSVNAWGSGFNSFMDLNQDGVIDFCKKVSNRIECQAAKQNNHGTLLLKSVTNGLGHKSRVWFGPYKDHTIAESFQSAEPGKRNLPASYPVAYRLETDNGKGKNNYLFQFGPVRNSVDGATESGFTWIRQRDFVDGINARNTETHFYTEFPYTGLIRKHTDYLGNHQNLSADCEECVEGSFWNFRELRLLGSSQIDYASHQQTFTATKILRSETQVAREVELLASDYKLVEYQGKKYASDADKFVPIGGSPLTPIIVPSTQYFLVEEEVTDPKIASPIWSMSTVSDQMNAELLQQRLPTQIVKAVKKSDYTTVVNYISTPINRSSYATYQKQRVDTRYTDTGDVQSVVKVEQLDVDQFGNVGKFITTTSGVNPITGREEVFSEITENRYSNNESRWLVGLLEHTKTTLVHSDGSQSSKEAVFAYDPQTGLLVEQIEYPGTAFAVKTAKQRNAQGIVELEATTAANGNFNETRSTAYQFTYEGDVVKTKITNPLGQVAEESMDLYQGVISNRDANGLTTTTTLDGFGRETQIRTSNGMLQSAIHRYSADNDNCKFSLSNAVYCIVNESIGSGKKISLYDFLEREVRKATLSVDGKWVLVDSSYDAKGNLISVTKPYYQGDIPQYITTTYDDLGRIVSVREPGPAGKEENWVTYQYAPFSVAKTDANGRVNTTYTNVLGWEIQKTEPQGGSIRYEYYANGLLKNAIASEGEIVSTKYNLQGKKTFIDDPDLGIWTYVYDGFGQLVQQTDAKGQTVNFSYDKLGRKSTQTEESVVIANGEEQSKSRTIYWRYDQVGSRQWVGALLQTEVAGETIKNFVYNDKGLLSREEVITEDHTFTRDLEYNTIGQLIRESRPDQFVLHYERDGATGINTEVWGDISQAQVNFTEQEFNQVIQPLITEALAKAKEYVSNIRNLQEQQYFYAQRRKEYEALQANVISFDGRAENEQFSQKMYSELHGRPLTVYVDEYGERYFEVSSRTVLIPASVLIPIIQQPKFHLKIEGNLLRQVSLEEWEMVKNLLQDEGQVAYYGNYSRDGGMSLATFNLDRDDPLYDQRMRAMFTELTDLAGEIDRLEYVEQLTTQRMQSYLAAAEQLVKLVKQVKLVSQKYQALASQSQSESNWLSELKEQNPEAGKVTYWKLNALDAEGRITSEIFGNGLVNSYDYHEGNGQLLNIYTKQGTKLVRGIHYSYDRMDNVKSRHDLVNDIKETYYYDKQDRLTDYYLEGVNQAHADNPLFNKTYSMAYAANGNIRYKSDVGHYVYADPKHKHAVTQVGELTYSYDANGNLLSDSNRDIRWNVWNKPAEIVKGNAWVRFNYDESNTRYQKQTNTGDTTWYFGKVYERTELSSGDIQHKQFIYAGDGLVAVNINTVKTDGSGNFASVDRQIRYSHADALKSVDMVTDMWGNVVDRKLYDPWGKVRPFEWAQPQNDLLQAVMFNRTYTGHESIDEVGLIHMNGRLYDASIARFISADIFIQSPDNSQSFNRYSYVLNNPLKYNDPSGHFFKRIGREFRRQWNDLKDFVDKHRKIVAIVTSVVVTVYTGGAYAGMLAKYGGSYLASGTMANGITAGALAGASGGAFAGGILTESWDGALRGAAVGAITGAIGAYNGLSPTKGWLDATRKVAVSATGGCATGKIVGGSCSDGAKFAALSQAIILGFEYMKNATDSYKLRSCRGGHSICKYNKDGDLLTDGTRGHTQIPGTSPEGGNWLTRKFVNGGMAPEASGHHRYSESGLIGRFINKVSKVHDYFNSDISKLFGFQGYDSWSGQWLQGTHSYNFAFQTYSFVGMLPAAIYTGAALVAPYPVYPYSQFERK
ncbi:RHS repeat-associated core domain-containing protein [Vibrio vulnificus]|nr:type IV secretion protein Rhs [Vibrio vulnificus]HDY8126493.1 type IV secretion protein Rhs [Vibrio vulnificus]HDZ3275614.1 type IV secretion protein Rhs [Vibrio vulnificus]